MRSGRALYLVVRFPQKGKDGYNHMSDMRNGFTKRLLADASIEEGMRVLDVGCGRGDVAAIVAETMGNSGEVVGVDMDEEALAAARDAAAGKGLSCVQFFRADLNDLPCSLGLFDAVVGRRVLMYQRSAARSLETLLPRLLPGGLMVFQESDSMCTGAGESRMPLHSKALSWIWETVAGEGGDIHMGLNLYPLCRKAGLDVVEIRSEAVLQTEETGSDLAWVIGMMLPRIVGAGVAETEEIDIDTLALRLEHERRETGGVFVRDMAFGIVAKRQG